MSKSINVGVIGLGFMGATHVAAYQAAAAAGLPCRLTAVADPREDRRTGKFAGVGGNLDSGGDDAAFDAATVRGYASAEELIADPDIDLVSICTRTDTHVPMAEAALRAGKHVLVEKPVAVTADVVRRLADVAAECGRCCMPAMCMRFWPAWMWLKETIDSGRLGQLKSIRFTRLGSRPGWNEFYADPAVSGGALIDLHVHDTDFICYLFGQPASVSSAGTLDHVTTLYAFPGVSHVVAEGGWDQHPGFGFTMRYVANFERATVDFDIKRDAQLLLCREEAEPVEVSPLTGYDGEVRHLVESVAAGRCPSVSLEDAWLTHRVLDAERRSIENGRPADV